MKRVFMRLLLIDDVVSDATTAVAVTGRIRWPLRRERLRDLSDMSAVDLLDEQLAFDARGPKGRC